MARARNIKPGFFKNEDLAECSPWARLCFAGLWVLADREGRLEDRPKRIKGELFPFDAVEVDPLLEELVRFGFIARYDAGSIKAIQILEFKKHQTPHYSEKASVINPPPFLEQPEDDEPEIPGLFQEDSKKPPGIKRGSEPSDSLNPDSLNPDSPIPVGGAGGDAPPPPPPAPPPAPAAVAGKGGRRKRGEVTLAEWLEVEKAAGRQAVPSDDAIFRYADKVGIPRDFLRIAWRAFVTRYTEPPTKGEKPKTYTDWRAAFRNAIRDNWLKLWYLDGQQYALTTAGQQAQRAHQAAPAPQPAQHHEGEPA